MSSGELPFIEKFKIDNKFYIYDVNTNSFLRVDELVYTFVDKDQSKHSGDSKILEKYSAKKIEETKENIKLMKGKGYFSSHRPQITYFHTLAKESLISHIKDILNKRLHKVTLVLSERCNMRCRYCAYSGKYLYNRKHTQKTMTPEVMRKAVDFYFSRSSANDEKNLSIYGGEPLYSFGLLKECIDYVRGKYTTDAHYNMTTNGTLLDKERVEFLVKNRFTLLVSIDGPKVIHNRYRVFRNGKGTFDCIIRNLKRMKAMYPEYYQSKVRFNLVLHPPLDFERINEFISDPEIKPASIRFSNVNTHFTTFFNQFTSDQMEAFRSSRKNSRNSFYRKVIKGKELNGFEKNRFRTKFLYIHRRDMKRLPDKYPSNGQCILGERALLVNTDGSLNFCSRIDDSFNLGNVFKGYDYKRIEKIYFDMDRLFAKRCFGCWAIRFCMKCIKDINRNGEVDEEVFEQFCRSRKKTILNEMKDYIKIRENNSHALDYLEDVTVS